MIEFIEASSPVGTGFPPGRYGAQTDSPQVSLSQRLGEEVYAVTGVPKQGSVLDTCDRVAAGRMVWLEDPPTRWIPVGPREWLVLGALRGTTVVEMLLGGAPRMFDLSHGRAVFSLGGLRSQDVLEKGCPLDLNAFPSGRSASTVLGPFSIWLLRDPDGYDVIFNRSYARSGWEWLARASLEFGLEVRASKAWRVG